MLTFGAPGALWLGLAAIPVVVLYFLRRRFRRRPSGSNFIWSRVASSAPGARRPELRSIALLALQLAAVLSATLAAAGPAVVSARSARTGLGILIDVSASMAARGQGGDGAAFATRVEAAAAAAREELAGLAGGRPVALFACAGDLRPLSLPGSSIGGDGARAVQATRRLAATDEGFLEDRVASSLTAWLATRPESWDFTLYTDGGLDLGGSRLAEVAQLRFVVLGGGGGGEGLASLRVAAEGRKGTASFRAFNGRGQDLRVTLRLTHDGAPMAEEAAVLPPGWSGHNLALGRAPAEGAWVLSAEAGGTVVGLARFALNAPEPRKVLVVGKDDPYLRAALAYPGLRLSSAPSFPGPEVASTYDLVVAEGVSAPAKLGAPLLAFGALPEGAPLEPLGEVGGRLATVANGHPLGRFVEWEGVAAERASTVVPGPGVAVLASAGPAAGAVAVAWTEGGLARAYVGLDPARSDFGLSPAWPLFLRNLLDWASPHGEGGPGYNLDAGDVAQRVEPEDFRISGRGAPAVRRSGRMAYIEARESGLYRWTSGGGSGWVAVNVPAGELDLAPRALAPPPARATALAPMERRRVDLGPLPLLLLLASLVAEWLAWRGLPPVLAGRGRDARR